MNPDTEIRPLDVLFKEHLDNSIECGQILNLLFLNLHDPEPHIARIKRLEERGDRLTAEAYHALELLPYSELVYLTQQFVKRLDDIVDGMNDTARVIDIFIPGQAEEAARQILALILEMAARLLAEVRRYPNNELASVRQCRETLKKAEEKADMVYHEWRKAHRRHSSLSLISETDWTEILGILEATTDACYHSALLLERITRYHWRQSAS